MNDDQETLLGGKNPVGIPEACCKCLKIGCCIISALVLLLLLLILRIWCAECAIDSFDHHLILPENAKAAGVPEPYDMGTTDNMDLTPIDVDLRGVWWMDGNPLTAEHLVSFASAKAEKPFPVDVPVFNNRARRWTWTDGLTGRLIMFYYAFDAHVESEAIFQFQNSSYANIVPVGGVFSGDFGFDKINDDEWDRPDANYVLRRVVNGDGTEGPFWQKFITWYDGQQENGKMLVWNDDSDCWRRCQYFLPCFMCGAIC